MIALRKMAMKEAFAGTEAQQHIQALMVIVSRNYDLPHPLAHEDHVLQATSTLSSATPPSPSSSASSSSSSAVTTLAPPQDMAVPAKTVETPSRAKRRERPSQTLRSTPSPLAKGGRLTEPPAQADQQPATTSNIQQPATNRKESESKEDGTGKRKSDWQREYKLSQEIRAIGGVIVNEDEGNRYRQHRATGTDQTVEEGGELKQWCLGSALHPCALYLTKWYKAKETTCQACGHITKREKLRYDAIKSWTCNKHDYQVCVRCIPVVLTTSFTPIR